jgi:hypothetical protein|eukprot:CAMPEP_0174285264 /NCGR_PEP_ID=MMETSP0809-20121228/8132_1 /TAXON_ID=73025 ORGANISM="Eutreptiella gymnastica-like, Strain CCMP1594" /NCGR_SAMPLE_ID=MMETSP0809 /ASSEMBLY_ACC=CAM_ASM_000658 /LENGTH=239 /DNA_ID=CAMNT_0015380981 /DNA_START=23 /DNA_END=742 /DNA_ORIENTATION=-
MVPTVLTQLLANAVWILCTVAISEKNWSKFALIGGSETRWGLWNFLDSNPLYCEGWVIATAAMTILALVFGFFTGVVAAVVSHKTKKKLGYKTKPLRLIMALLAFMTFTFTILAVVFWICFNEWPPCWMNYSDATWANVNATYQYTKYDWCWMLVCAACGCALIMCLTAYWSVAKTPKPPVLAPPEPTYPVVEYPMVEYPTQPAYVAYPSAPVYPTTAYSSVYVPSYPTAAAYPTVSQF